MCVRNKLKTEKQNRDYFRNYFCDAKHFMQPRRWIHSTNPPTPCIHVIVICLTYSIRRSAAVQRVLRLIVICSRRRFYYVRKTYFTGTSDFAPGRLSRHRPCVQLSEIRILSRTNDRRRRTRSHAKQTPTSTTGRCRPSSFSIGPRTHARSAHAGDQSSALGTERRAVPCARRTESCRRPAVSVLAHDWLTTTSCRD